jgi:hypothetical protein
MPSVSWTDTLKSCSGRLRRGIGGHKASGASRPRRQQTTFAGRGSVRGAQAGDPRQRFFTGLPRFGAGDCGAPRDEPHAGPRGDHPAPGGWSGPRFVEARCPGLSARSGGRARNLRCHHRSASPSPTNSKRPPREWRRLCKKTTCSLGQPPTMRSTAPSSRVVATVDSAGSLRR